MRPRNIRPVRRSKPSLPLHEAQAIALPRALTEADAIDIWLARWMRVRLRDLIARYGCDPRRLYEIWEGARFPQSRAKALDILADKHPSVMSRVDLGNHKRVPSRSHSPDQLSFFD